MRGAVLTLKKAQSQFGETPRKKYNGSETSLSLIEVFCENELDTGIAGQVKAKVEAIHALDLNVET